MRCWVEWRKSPARMSVNDRAGLSPFRIMNVQASPPWLQTSAYVSTGPSALFRADKKKGDVFLGLTLEEVASRAECISVTGPS